MGSSWLMLPQGVCRQYEHLGSFFCSSGPFFNGLWNVTGFNIKKINNNNNNDNPLQQFGVWWLRSYCLIVRSICTCVVSTQDCAQVWLVPLHPHEAQLNDELVIMLQSMAHILRTFKKKIILQISRFQ